MAHLSSLAIIVLSEVTTLCRFEMFIPSTRIKPLALSAWLRSSGGVCLNWLSGMMISGGLPNDRGCICTPIGGAEEQPLN